MIALVVEIKDKLLIYPSDPSPSTVVLRVSVFTIVYVLDPDPRDKAPLLVLRFVYPPAASLIFIVCVKKFPRTSSVLSPYTSIVCVRMVLAYIASTLIVLTHVLILLIVSTQRTFEEYIKFEYPIAIFPVSFVLKTAFSIFTFIADPVGPISPVAPSSPCGPVDPVEPVDPVAPVGPVAPVDPVAPVAPVKPVIPVGPIAPVAPVDPVDECDEIIANIIS